MILRGSSDLITLTNVGNVWNPQQQNTKCEQLLLLSEAFCVCFSSVCWRDASNALGSILLPKEEFRFKVTHTVYDDSPLTKELLPKQTNYT